MGWQGRVAARNPGSQSGPVERVANPHRRPSRMPGCYLAPPSAEHRPDRVATGRAVFPMIEQYRSRALDRSAAHIECCRGSNTC